MDIKGNNKGELYALSCLRNSTALQLQIVISELSKSNITYDKKKKLMSEKYDLEFRLELMINHIDRLKHGLYYK